MSTIAHEPAPTLIGDTAMEADVKCVAQSDPSDALNALDALLLSMPSLDVASDLQENDAAPVVPAPREGMTPREGAQVDADAAWIEACVGTEEMSMEIPSLRKSVELDFPVWSSTARPQGEHAAGAGQHENQEKDGSPIAASRALLRRRRCRKPDLKMVMNQGPMDADPNASQDVEAKPVQSPGPTSGVITATDGQSIQGYVSALTPPKQARRVQPRVLASDVSEPCSQQVALSGPSESPRSGGNSDDIYMKTVSPKVARRCREPRRNGPECLPTDTNASVEVVAPEVVRAQERAARAGRVVANIVNRLRMRAMPLPPLCDHIDESLPSRATTSEAILGATAREHAAAHQPNGSMAKRAKTLSTQ